MSEPTFYKYKQVFAFPNRWQYYDYCLNIRFKKSSDSHSYVITSHFSKPLISPNKVIVRIKCTMPVYFLVLVANYKKLLERLLNLNIATHLESPEDLKEMMARPT